MSVLVMASLRKHAVCAFADECSREDQGRSRRGTWESYTLRTPRSTNRRVIKRVREDEEWRISRKGCLFENEDGFE